MANKRMFSTNILESDAFVDMPASSQCLYIHLCLNADDDGFIGSPKRVMRMVNAHEDDLKVLVTKRFLLTFQSGIVVIKHWLIHNSLGRNRYHETTYIDEKRQLRVKADKSYSFTEGVPLITEKEPETVLIESDAPMERQRRASDAPTAHSDIGLDIDIDLEKKKSEKEKETNTKQTRFVKPSLDELVAYKQEHKLNVDCNKFFDFYESKGWMVGKNHMKDWRAAMRNWSSRERPEKPRAGNKFMNFEQRIVDYDALLQERMDARHVPKEVDSHGSGA